MGILPLQPRTATMPGTQFRLDTVGVCAVSNVSGILDRRADRKEWAADPGSPRNQVQDCVEYAAGGTGHGEVWQRFVLSMESTEPIRRFMRRRGMNGVDRINLVGKCALQNSRQCSPCH